MAAFLLAAQPVQASKFTGEQFLKWSKGSQTSFIETSITMVAIVATQGRQDIAACIDGWYPLEESQKQLRHEEILTTIRRYPDNHPQGIILAVLQKHCGSFKKRAN